MRSLYTIATGGGDGEDKSTYWDALTQTRVLEIPSRYRSPALLIFGSASAVLGFFCISVIGFIEYQVNRENRAIGKPYASGQGYWPSTVSEMVFDGDKPGGKLFYSFGLIAGICIFSSNYPANLRNVYTGPERVLNTPVYWSTFRQLCPSMGLWLLIGVNTYPTEIALHSTGMTKLFCVLLHLVGAGMLFVGYMVSELKCLGMAGFKERYEGLAIESRERRIRTALAWLILISFCLFCFMQFLLNAAKKLNVCCGDEWSLNGLKVEKDGVMHQVHGVQLTNTASGVFFWLKVLSFICEDIAGVSLVASHIAIWFFCEERMVDYGKFRLKEVHNQSRDE